jgi:hypothetical protein
MDLGEKVRRIEKLDLDIGDKKGLILIAAGIKPNYIVKVRRCNKDQYRNGRFEIPAGFFESIAEVVDSIGIRIEAGTQTNDHKSVTSKAYPDLAPLSIEERALYIGQQPLLVKAVDEKPLQSPGDHMTYGILMGFPETAIHAFCFEKDALIDPRFGHEVIDRPTDRSIDTLRFLDFRPTERNLEKELEIPRTYKNLIRNVSPRIYDAIIKFYEKAKEKRPTPEMVKYLYTAP